MNEVNKFYDMAALSEASYVLFDQVDIKNEKEVEDALANPSYEGSFSATQAKEFVEHWQVIDHQANTDNGYSSTVFKSKTRSEYVLAFRGTEGLFSDDLAITDLGDIVGDGLAIKQIVDMHNDIHRMRAAAGATYSMAALELNVLETDRLSNAARNPVLYKQVKAELLARTDLPEDGMAVYNVVLSDATATEDGALKDAASITVTGHSLGGHLASAASRLFPGLVQDVLTINGAGFSLATEGFKHANVRNLFALLGGATAFDSTKILNLFGSEGPEMVTMDSYMGLKQPGAHKEIFIENWNWQNVFGHGAVQMTDAMAIYDLFFRIDEQFRTGELGAVLAELKPLFEAASNAKNGTFESVVNVIGGQLVPDYAPIQQPEWGDREKLHSKVLAIQEAVEGKNLQVTSLVSLTADQLKAQAMSADELGLATRYALVNLSPVSGFEELVAA